MRDTQNGLQLLYLGLALIRLECIDTPKIQTADLTFPEIVYTGCLPRICSRSLAPGLTPAHTGPGGATSTAHHHRPCRGTPATFFFTLTHSTAQYVTPRPPQFPLRCRRSEAWTDFSPCCESRGHLPPTRAYLSLVRPHPALRPVRRPSGTRPAVPVLPAAHDYFECQWDTSCHFRLATPLPNQQGVSQLYAAGSPRRCGISHVPLAYPCPVRPLAAARGAASSAAGPASRTGQGQPHTQPPTSPAAQATPGQAGTANRPRRPRRGQMGPIRLDPARPAASLAQHPAPPTL